jgi:hypothetical protein
MKLRSYLRAGILIPLLTTSGCKTGGTAAHLQGANEQTKTSPAPKDTRLVELGVGSAFTVNRAALQGPEVGDNGLNVPGGNYWMRLEAFVPKNASGYDLRRVQCDVVFEHQQYPQILPFAQGLYVDAVTPMDRDVKYNIRMTADPHDPPPATPPNLLKVQNIYCYYSNLTFDPLRTQVATVQDVACVLSSWVAIPANVPNNPAATCDFPGVAYKPVAFVNTPFEEPATGPAPGTPGGPDIFKCSACYPDPNDRSLFYYEKYKNGRNAGESSRYPNESACIDAIRADTANCQNQQ